MVPDAAATFFYVLAVSYERALAQIRWTVHITYGYYCRRRGGAHVSRVALR